MKKKKAPPQTMGCLSELRACAYLIGRGYMVFRNVSSCGPIDIIAVREGETRFFDVKTGQPRPAGGMWAKSARLTEKQKNLNVDLLYVHSDGSCVSGSEIRLYNEGKFESARACKICSGPFVVTLSTKTRKYCSTVCIMKTRREKKKSAARLKAKEDRIKRFQNLRVVSPSALAAANQ